MKSGINIDTCVTKKGRLQMASKYENNYTDKIYNNIKTLVGMRDDIKIGTLESEMGLAVGYLSRRCNYNINLIYDISKRLGVSIEDLIEKDYSYEAKKYELEASVKSLQEQLQHAQELLADFNKNGEE